MGIIKTIPLTELFHYLQHTTSYLSKTTLIVLAIIGIVTGIHGIRQINASGLLGIRGAIFKKLS